MKKRSLHILFIFLIALVVMFLAAALYYYYFNDLGKTREELQAKEADQKSLGEKTNRVIVSRNQLLKIGGEESEIYSHLVTSGDEATFISSLESLCTNDGLLCNMSNLSLTKDPNAPSSVSLFNITVQTSGSFDNSLVFLKNLENSNFPLLISSIQIMKLDDKWKGTFVVSVPTLAHQKI